MKGQKISLYAILGGVLVIGTVLGMQIQSAMSEDNTLQQLQKLEEAYSKITKNYVEDVDTSDLVDDAIEGMLGGLDPHSVYIDATQMRRVRENFNASFDGIGISYEWTEGAEDLDTLTVLQPLPGGPSEEVGLMAGDRIIEVDGSTTLGWEQKDVNENLKGPRGTQVDIVVKRPYYPGLLSFTITRDKIPLHTVEPAYMVDSQTGYIKLNRFAASTGDEVNQALRQLKGEGMQRLILDLRGNVGGYMDMAIRVSDEFLPAGDMIVYTKSRHARFNGEYRATSAGQFEKQPVIVLIDEYSASASEIVAGALQDHDRGLIVGLRSFGKGLVQRQFPLPDGSVLQMTTSRYYTPSGRLIQTPYENGETDDYYAQHRDRVGNNDLSVVDMQRFVEEVPDSLKYETTGGRTVFGGGGIMPDFVIPSDTTGALLRVVIARSLDMNYVRSYIERTPELREEWGDRPWDFINEYEVTDEFVDGFFDYAREEESRLQIAADATFETDDDLYTLSTAQVEAGDVSLRTRLKASMARRLFGIGYWHPVIRDIDDTFQEAMGLWPEAKDLAVN
ncbi:MAG: S41 family peptidase [Bacteroidota bacterium]